MRGNSGSGKRDTVVLSARVPREVAARLQERKVGIRQLIERELKEGAAVPADADKNAYERGVLEGRRQAYADLRKRMEAAARLEATLERQAGELAVAWEQVRTIAAQVQVMNGPKASSLLPAHRSSSGWWAEAAARWKRAVHMR